MAAGSIVKFFIEGVATSLLGIFGIIGNLVSVVVLSSSELDMMPSFRHLLRMLAAFDATFLVFTLTLFGISPWSDQYNQYIKPYPIPYFLPIIQVNLWTILFIDIPNKNRPISIHDYVAKIFFNDIFNHALKSG